MLRSLKGALIVLAVAGLSCCPEGEGGFNLGTSAIIIVQPDPVQFSTVSVGDTATEIITISNSGDASGDLVMESVTLLKATHDLSITPPLETTLAPGASTTMQVFYSPSDAEKDYGEIHIEYKGSKEVKVVPIITLAQVGTLQISPNPVNFGEVSGGTVAIKKVKVTNNGSKDVEIGTIALDFSGSDDFSYLGVYAIDGDQCGGLTDANALELPYTLALGSAFCLDLRYVPTEGGTDITQLQLFPPYEGETPAPEAVAPVLGGETGPDLKVLPESKLDFGAVPLGEVGELSFQITNNGNQDLVIESVAKAANLQDAFGDVTILTDVPAGTVIAPGEGTTVDVKFEPTDVWPISYDPLGFIEIKSNDLPESLTVFGQVAAPKLQVTPSPLVDFGVVALNKDAERTVTFTNVGTVAVTIDNLAITDNTQDVEFEILDAPAGTITLEDGDWVNVKLKFTNTASTTGQANGKLGFESNDPNAPVSVDLRALRTDTAICNIALQPAQLNYGTVPYGKEKTMKMGVKNVGSGACGWKSAYLGDGFEIFPGIGGCIAGSGSGSFSVDGTPFGCADCIKPGDIVYVDVRFEPEANFFSELSEFIGYKSSLQVTMFDPENGNDVVQPPSDANGGVLCNLVAQSGSANLTAIPGEIDFGVTTIGCHSETVTVTMYNTGKAPLSVCDIKLEGCSPEVKLKSVPPIGVCTEDGGGLVLKQGTPSEVKIVYAPQDLNEDTCSLAIYENSDTPSLTIPIIGSGTYDDEQTDVFIQQPGNKVDVLFVVDNSGSMSDEQKSLSNNFGSLLTSAATWSTDYNLGVVTTDMEENNPMAGKLMGPDSVSGGGFVSNYKESLPRYVKAVDSAQFKDMVKVGDSGSGTEQGLKAAQTALTSPHTTTVLPVTECVIDEDCPASFQCVPSHEEPGKSFCGGWNMGFMRDDASLEVVFVSDEEDSSEADLNFYVDFLKALKGFANENLFHAHAIVGPNGGCDGPGGSAADGSRYRFVANETGGVTHSICDANWSAKLNDIGDVAFGLKVQFFLTRPAVPDSLTVTVAGQSCTQGWNYDQDSNSVIFDETSPCMPQVGEEISIHYEVICYEN